MSNKLDDDQKGKETPKAYAYLYCRHCGKYFTMNSTVNGLCPYCTPKAPKGRYFSLAVIEKNEPVRDRLYLALKKCAYCADAYRCPECFGASKKNPEHCRFCTCTTCCNECTEFANGIRSGKISFSQVFRDRIAKKGIKPGPMAGMVERAFEDEIPF